MHSSSPNMSTTAGSSSRYTNESVHAQDLPRQFAPKRSSEKVAEKTPRNTRFFDAIITISITALFFGVPLFFTSLTMQGIVFDKQMYFYFWLLVALVAWATKSAMSGELTIRRTPLDYPILATLGAVIISTYLSDDRWHSFWGMFGDPSRGLVGLVAAILAFYIIITHFTRRRFTWFFGALILSGSIVILWTFLGLLGVGFLPKAFAAYAPLSIIGSLKGLGLFLSAMVPLLISALFGLWDDGVRIKKFVRVTLSGALGIVTMLALVNIFSLLSYTPLIALAIGAAFFLIFILARLVRPHGGLSFIPMVFLVVVAGFLMIQSPQNTIRSPFINKNITLSPEVTLNKSFSWDIAKASLKEHFFFGYGPGQYGQAFSLARPESFNTHPLYTLRFMQGEGLFFDGLSTIGIIGTILATLTVLTFVSVSIYLMMRQQERNKLYSLGLVSATLTITIAVALYRVDGAIMLVGVLLAALTFAMLYYESDMMFNTIALSLKASPKFALSLAFISIVLIAGVGMSFFFVGKIFVADLFAGRAVRAQEVTVDTISNLTRAARLNRHEGRYRTRMGQEFMVLANREALKPKDKRDLQALRTYLQSAQAAALDGRTLLPADVVAAEVYAQILENASYYDTNLLDAVDEAYKAVLDREPSNAIYIAKRGDITLRKALLIDPKKEDERKDMLAKARDFFTKAIEKKPNLASAYYQRALIKQGLDDLDGAIDDMEKAFVASGNANITYAYNLGVLYKARDGENDAARAELLFRSILGVNDKEINAHLELATLYKQKNKVAAAIKEYKTVLDLLPKDGDGVAKARENIQNIINRLQQSGVSVAQKENVPVTQGQASSAADGTQQAPAQQQAPAPAAP